MIEISNLVKRYGKGKAAVDDISLNIGKGEIVGFLGPNGAGKSTTMNIITGYLSATSGTVKVAGYDVLENPMEAKKHIGFLPEQPPLYLDMTVKEYLGFVFDLKKCTLNKKAHINEIVDILNIGDYFKRPINQLSKGYRQRVGLAQALISSPDILIFDEPTVGLDPKQIIEIRELISSLGKNHTVILSTHILPEVNAVCDRVVIIDKGRIVADEKTSELEAVTGMRKMRVKACGPRNEVLRTLQNVNGVVSVSILPERDADSTSFLVEAQTNVDVRASIFHALAQNDYPMIGLEGFYSSLEDVFIAILDKNKKEGNA
ncbi:MAG: ATP-binding cassette domain-containing protein [Ruminococcaceae bacterium]|nr:ATP-binding cassette domain-containing protein [Oscillospiraceae bacterium]